MCRWVQRVNCGPESRRIPDRPSLSAAQRIQQAHRKLSAPTEGAPMTLFNDTSTACETARLLVLRLEETGSHEPWKEYRHAPAYSPNQSLSIVSLARTASPNASGAPTPPPLDDGAGAGA